MSVRKDSLQRNAISVMQASCQRVQERMIRQNRKSLRNHSNRVEPEGFLYLCQPVADVRERTLFQTGYLRL